MKMPALFDLTGRVTVVTGGNGGIGRGIALGLAEAGAAVAFFHRRTRALEIFNRVIMTPQVSGMRLLSH